MNTETRYYWDGENLGSTDVSIGATFTGRAAFERIEVTPELKARLGTQPREVKLNEHFQWQYEYLSINDTNEWCYTDKEGYEAMGTVNPHARRIIAIPPTSVEGVAITMKHYKELRLAESQLKEEREMSARVAEMLDYLFMKCREVTHQEERFYEMLDISYAPIQDALNSYRNHLNKQHGKV